MNENPVKLNKQMTDSRETAFLFQRLSIAGPRFNAACIVDTPNFWVCTVSFSDMFYSFKKQTN